MVLRQKGGMRAHVREGDEDMITQKYKPQNEILGLSASKGSNKILTFLSGHNSPLCYLSLGLYLASSASPFFPLLIFPCLRPPLVHPSQQWFAVIPPDPGNQGSDAAQPKQMQCFPSKIFITRRSCATSSTFQKAVFKSSWYYPSPLRLPFALTLHFTAIFPNVWSHPLHSVSIYSTGPDLKKKKKCTPFPHNHSSVITCQLHGFHVLLMFSQKIH